MRFLLFILGVFGGLLLIIYHRQVARSLGVRILWAEKIFGQGGTYYGYIVIGLIAVFLGILIGLGFIPVTWFSSPI